MNEQKEEREKRTLELTKNWEKKSQTKYKYKGE